MAGVGDIAGALVGDDVGGMGVVDELAGALVEDGVGRMGGVSVADWAIAVDEARVAPGVDTMGTSVADALAAVGAGSVCVGRMMVDRVGSSVGCGWGVLFGRSDGVGSDSVGAAVVATPTDPSVAEGAAGVTALPPSPRSPITRAPANR